MNTSHRYACLLTFALAASLLCVGCGSKLDTQADADAEAPAASEQTGAAQLADFTTRVYTYDGDGRSLSEIADGRPLVVNFWATWCPYCVEELPAFADVSAGYGDKVAFAFIDVVDDDDENPENTAAWLSEYGFEKLPVYYDNDNITQEFGVYAFPTTVIFAPDGSPAATYMGAMDSAALQTEIDKLL